MTRAASLTLAAMLMALSLPAAAAMPTQHHYQQGYPHGVSHGFPHSFHNNFHPGPGPAAHGLFGGHDLSHFSVQEHAMWTQGRWRHDWHHGHFGWWFVAGGAWFFYDQPVYPYPEYVGGYYDEGYPPDYDNAPGQYWYYCDDPQGYYPYVKECNGPWRPVPPTPPMDAPAPPDQDDNN